MSAGFPRALVDNFLLAEHGRIVGHVDSTGDVVVCVREDSLWGLYLDRSDVASLLFCPPDYFGIDPWRGAVERPLGFPEIAANVSDAIREARKVGA
jgi:hypothetical protein